MNSEEFELFCNNQDKDLAEAITRQEKFLADTEKCIIDIAFNTYPKLKPHAAYFINALKIEAHQQVLGITELIDGFLYLPSANDSNEDPNIYKVPNPNDDGTEAEELAAMLNNIQKPHSKQLITQLKK